MADWLTAILLGLVEGLTEFIPVSSTGHLLLLGHFLGFESTGKTFEIVIQLGALLAIISVYFKRLWTLATRWPFDPEARRFLIGLLVAFAPAVVIGFLAYGFIKTVLFETPLVVCVALIVGGLLLLWLDRLKKMPTYLDADRYPFRVYFLIGLFQCLAMVPGVSRSGATIAGGLLLGTDKRSAAEFSFFLALPTMGAAVFYDLFKNRDVLDFSDFGLIAVGFIAAFLTALVVVRFLLDFVSRRGFGPFAWWRIVVGVAGIIGLAVTGAL
ncbi:MULTISPECIES: undecaprenyl-diphosphate phosphatase [Brevundimonas]|jgi:undecaprenyl-diphosphatase|uniref:undecaprenyl-diphosphate phosphatase n=1 Tax=Brevundimonas TaxID=41275 RepID=UPI000E0A3D4A|nr:MULTISPECIES: undecaprenyl-diphosphate phosphatase [Brevundimonas]MBD3832963.1 undecaprenyl-diphosphate phosphatase [Brevundimonas sp.]NWE51020.1 undecaprenyl-diphosphate phosphatase [Brevundimonas sp. P7753]WQE36199.1 undecaprenyl-diphosphate phosphatase [Brevundimonas bullata]